MSEEISTLCNVRHCGEQALVEANEVQGYHHRYCLRHLWMIDETDDVYLIGDGTQSARSRPYEAPITMAEPIFGDDGFSKGFRVVHPPGVECAYRPETNQCSCGRFNPTLTAESSTEPDPAQS